jgi:glycosyltransferase involved in cell wall biosynthesis
VPERLKVFYNASALPDRPAGAGVYTIQLARALAGSSEVELLTAVNPVHDLGVPPAISLRNPRPSWEIFQLSAALRSAAPDVYHGPHFFVPRTSVPSVATVHDLTFYRLPRRYDFAHRHYYRYLARTARRACRVIVPSPAVASDAVRYLGLEPAAIRVVPEAPRAGFEPASALEVEQLCARLGLESPYLLCLGTAEPGKRAIDAIRAMPAIRQRVPEAMLALAGNPGRLTAALHAEVARLGLADAVHFLGYVPDAELPALLTGATALVFPSLFEGFGLPPLEALACGTPVVASDAPAMSQFLGPGVRFVPTRDPAAIARQVAALLTDPALRADLSAAGLEFAARFSWQHTAELTVEVYREAVS